MSNNVFDLNHVFVLFPPGGSGNFISSLIRNIINKDFTQIHLSSSGNAHAFSNTASEYDAVFACGMISNIPYFVTEEEKLKFYREKISQGYSGTTKPIVTWSHDYSNIETYKVLFPNSKILAITQTSKRERIIQLILQNLKNRMDPAGVVFFKDDIFKTRWTNTCKSWLYHLLWPGCEDLTDEIVNNKLDPKYFNLVLFISITSELRLFNMDLNDETIVDYSDHCLISRYDVDPEFSKKLDALPAGTKTKHVSFCIKNHNSYYYNQTKNILPFDIILDNDHVKLVSVIEQLLERPLDDSEIKFVIESLRHYHSKQPQLLIDDYMVYINQLKQSAMQTLSDLKSEFKK